jgi:glycosyltransferase involved in cell wall biosynthesis
MSLSLNQNHCDVSIIVPVFNEQQNIRPLYTEITAVCLRQTFSWEVVFVDDGSADASFGEITSLSSTDEHIHYICLRKNFGQTAALAAGIDHARGDIIITMDGDLQNDPADIPALIQKIHEGYDLVAGWRKNRKDPFFSVKLPSLLANTLIRKITGVNIHDTGCTLKAFKRSILHDLHLYGEIHRFIPALLFAKGARIAEIETTHRPRLTGASKYSPWKFFRVILDLLNVKFLISYATRPLHLFGKIAFYTFFLSFLSFVALFCMKIFWHVDMTGNPLMMVCIFLALLGVQFITIGLLGDIGIRTYHESTNTKIYTIREKTI